MSEAMLVPFISESVRFPPKAKDFELLNYQKNKISLNSHLTQTHQYTNSYTFGEKRPLLVIASPSMSEAVLGLGGVKGKKKLDNFSS